jgi:hypothetical protein
VLAEAQGKGLVLAETQGKGLPCRRWPLDHLPLTATFSLDYITLVVVVGRGLGGVR